MEDEILIKESIIDELKKESLDELSINELQERILSLKEEIDRVEKKIDVKKLSKNTADSIFKK
tara:strand:- start:699 stop:887 length:189 start_codon:yes stop_codon:yes gene_type:complete